MPKTYICPFWKWDRERITSCEGCRMRFPDDAAKREYAGRYCASTEGWKKCSVAESLLKFYDRTERNPQ